MPQTYNDLISDMQFWAQNQSDAFIAQIPRCIQFAELKLAREAKVLGYEKYVTFTPNLVAGTYVYAKPDRWRRTISIKIGTGEDGNSSKFLLPRDKTFMDMYWPDAAQRDEPEYYGDYGYSHIKIVPTPDENYPGEWGYFELPAPLGETNQTNWNTDYIYDVLLATCMLQAVRFLKNPDMIPVWQEVYQSYVSASSLEEFNRSLDRTEGQKGKSGP